MTRTLHQNFLGYNIEPAISESYSAMLQHLQGKRHIKNAKTIEARNQQIRSSVFIRGFPHFTGEKDLENYFAQYGQIVRFYFDINRRHFAIVEYESEEIALKVIRYKPHLINGYKMIVKEREGKPNTHRLSAALPAKAKKKKHHPGTSKMETDTSFTQDNCLQNMFEEAKNINEQMSMLKNTKALTTEDIEKRNSICKILHDVLQPYFPESNLHQFGSSVNGFGVKGCDLDLFLDFNDDKKEESKKLSKPVQLPYVRDITTLRKSHGPLYSHDLLQMSLYDKVKLASRILCEKGPGCNDIYCIPSTRCPVVRFVHELSGLKCDLSVNNRLALRNTQLLALYSRLDDRVKLLVFTVRYWAKLRKIAGNENAGPRLTNYALTLLVVYFLQNTIPPVLPSVEILANLSENKTIIDGWDCSFVEDINIIPKTDNTNTPAELLQKFFKFYSHIEFSAAVLQCKTSKPKLLTAFAQDMSSSKHLVQFKFGPISVQDPFVLEHNITLNVNEKTKQRIVEHFRIATIMSSNWLTTDKSDTVKDNKWGLVGLLCEELPSEFTDSASSEQEDMILSDKYSFPIVFKMSMLSEIAFKQLQTKGDYRYHWCLHVCSFLRKLLSEILLIDVQLETSTLKSPDEFSETPATSNVKDEPAIETHIQSSILNTDRLSSSSFECLTKTSANHNEHVVEVCKNKDESIENICVDCDSCQTGSVPAQNVQSEDHSYKMENTIDRSDLEDSNCEASARYVAGIIIDVSRSKRLSSDSLNESDSKRSRTCFSSNESDSETISMDNVEFQNPSVSFSNGSHIVNTNSAENPKEVNVKTTDSQSSPIATCENLLKMENSSDNLGELIWICNSECATFNGRKTVRKEVLNEGSTENLYLEREVSTRILHLHSNVKFKLGFRCILKPLISSGMTTVWLHFEPIENKKQFSCFYQFLKTFVVKMVDRYLFSE